MIKNPVHCICNDCAKRCKFKVCSILRNPLASSKNKLKDVVSIQYRAIYSYERLFSNNRFFADNKICLKGNHSFIRSDNFMEKAATDNFSSNIAQEVLDNISVFSGTLSFDGKVLTLKGSVFEKTDTNPYLLIGQKFSETVYWQASESVSAQLENAVKVAAKGKKTQVLLDFRVSADEILKVELFLQPFKNKGFDMNFFLRSRRNFARKRD